MSTSTALPGPEADFLSPDPSARQAAADYLKAVVDSAAALGADRLMGPLYQALGVFTGLPPNVSVLNPPTVQVRVSKAGSGGGGAGGASGGAGVTNPTPGEAQSNSDRE